MTRRPLRRPSLWILLLAPLLNAALLLEPVRYWAAFGLLWLLPGLGYAALLSKGSKGPRGEDLAVGLGLGIGTIALLTLLLHYIPGPLRPSLLLVGVDALLAGLIALGLRAEPSADALRLKDIPWPALAVILISSALLRLVHLGYSEFQGDEAVVLMRAAASLTGDGAQLFYHQKGPLEVLLPMATWSLNGAINEWQARLPFAFAGILGVVAVYLVGRRWLDGRAGAAGASLLAVNGYFVGFGRIVQYQSLVLAMTSLGLLALWRWYEEEATRWLLTGAALLAFGLLGHYDAALTLPAAGYIVLSRMGALYRRGGERSIPWRALGGAAATGLIVLLPFYLPFVLHPNFGKTLGYLGALALALAAAAFLSFRRSMLLVPAGCLLLALMLPARAAGPVLTLLLAVVFLREKAPSRRAAWLWFGAPFVFTFFLVWDPRTHVLNAYPGAVLLAGLVIDRIVGDARSKGRLFLMGSLLVGWVFLAGFPYLMFVHHEPEIKRTWPEHQPTLYWRPDLQVPEEGYFGFPYRAGWKVVGALMEQGGIEGPYASNEEQAITDWYTRGGERTYCESPSWYLIAENVQDEVPVDLAAHERSRRLWATVRVGGKPRIQVYHRAPVTTTAGTYDVHAFASEFDARTTPSHVLSQHPSGFTPTAYTLGQDVELVGYRLDAGQAHPGGSVTVVLYWRARRPLLKNYQVFTHLYDGTLWGQHDGAPACAMRPTTLWEPGRIVRDEHVIPVDPDAPVGGIGLFIGMYDLQSGERLPVDHPDRAAPDDAIPLTTVRVAREGTR